MVHGFVVASHPPAHDKRIAFDHLIGDGVIEVTHQTTR